MRTRLCPRVIDHDAVRIIYSFNINNTLIIVVDSFARAASELGLAGLAPDRAQHMTPIPSARRSKALHEEIALNIGHASFTWDNESTDVLRNINLEVPKGSLVIVIGQVGSGKSSLMLASLGEMRRTRGSTDLQGTVAYSAQVSNPHLHLYWITLF